MLAAFWRLPLGYVEASPAGGFRELARVIRARRCATGRVGRRCGHRGSRRSAPGHHIPQGPKTQGRQEPGAHLNVPAGGGRGEPWEAQWPRVTEAVGRLTAASATVIGEDVQDCILDHVVMADPGGTSSACSNARRSARSGDRRSSREQQCRPGQGPLAERTAAYQGASRRATSAIGAMTACRIEGRCCQVPTRSGQLSAPAGRLGGQPSAADRCAPGVGEAVTDSGRASPRLSAPSRR